MHMDILWFLLIGLIAGWLASRIMHSEGNSLISSMIIGIIGSLIGGFLFRLIGITAYGTLGSVIMAVIGAMLLIAGMRMIKRA